MRTRIFIFALFIFLLGRAQYVNHMYKFNLDNFPSVYGGKTEWKRFLRDNMVYPPADLKEKAEGTVLIAFVVTKEGKTLNPKIVESVTNDIDQEAMRLLSLIEWFPSTQNGIGVNVNHSVEINFSVSRYKKWVKERGFEKRLFTDLPADTTLAVYENPDKSATFFNTEKTFGEFISFNLEYPEEARRQGLEGNIAMSFIIEPNGTVSNLRIRNDGVGAGCNDEAIRVMSLTRWKPAVKDGKYVRSRRDYTMTFNVKNSYKDNSNASQRPFGQ